MSLLALPDEVLLYILAFLDSPCLGRLAAVCKRLRALARDDALWRGRLARELDGVGQAMATQGGTGGADAADTAYGLYSRLARLTSIAMARVADLRADDPSLLVASVRCIALDHTRRLAFVGCKRGLLQALRPDAVSLSVSLHASDAVNSLALVPGSDLLLAGMGRQEAGALVLGLEPGLGGVTAASPLARLGGHYDSVFAVHALSRELVATGGGQDCKRALVHSLTSAQAIATLAHKGSVRGLHSRPDAGAVLFTASLDKAVRLFDLRAGNQCELALNHAAGVHTVRCAGETLVLSSTGRSANAVYAWDMRAPAKPLLVFDEHRSAVSCVALDARKALYGSYDGSVSFLDWPGMLARGSPSADAADRTRLVSTTVKANVCIEAVADVSLWVGAACVLVGTDIGLYMLRA